MREPIFLLLPFTFHLSPITYSSQRERPIGTPCRPIAKRPITYSPKQCTIVLASLLTNAHLLTLSEPLNS